ncbi:MAG TPA: hypothetical protein VF064_03555 [Pyrinomonadaceae bacterium]
MASICFVASPAEAKAEPSAASASAAAASTAAPQWRQGRYNRRRARVYTTTRLVRRGRRVYRETYQIRYLPNGRTVTRLISRVRVR